MGVYVKVMETPTTKELLDIFFAKRPDAYSSIGNFRSLCHLIDDLIDIPERRADNEYIGMVFNKYLDFLSSDFYALYRIRLYPIIKHVHHTFFDSVKWEKNEEVWKQHYADVIRCCLNEYMLNVVEIVVSEELGTDAGYMARRKISTIAKEESWYNHHDETGKAI